MARQSTKRPPEHTPGTGYEDDLYTWAEEQTSHLRAGRLDNIDVKNVAEELSDVGNEQRDKLESAITVLAQHLLKWDYQPERRSRSWEGTVREQRKRVATVLKRNPGLKSKLAEAIEVGYALGRDRAYSETGLDYETFPENCPYTFDEFMTRDIGSPSA